jgi:hypothetical protein
MMDILQQVSRLLEELEAKEPAGHPDVGTRAVILLQKLSRTYNECIQTRQWKLAQDCLLSMLELVAEMAINPSSQP